MAGRQLDPRQPRPGKVLHPRGVARVRVELPDRGHRPRRAPPVVQRHAVREHGRGGLAVPAVAVHEQDPAEALTLERGDQLAQHLRVRLLCECEAARKRSEVGRDTERERRQHRHAERLSRLDRDALREDHVGREGEVGVLLGRPERERDPVVALEIRLELHPVQVGDPHPRRIMPYADRHGA